MSIDTTNPKTTITPEQKLAAFVHVWNNAGDSKTVANTLGMTRSSVQAKASQLRGLGYPLKSMRKGREKVIIDHNVVFGILKLDPSKINTDYRQKRQEKTEKRNVAIVNVLQAMNAPLNAPLNANKNEGVSPDNIPF